MLIPESKLPRLNTGYRHLTNIDKTLLIKYVITKL